jgi:hypothetical protein
MKSLILRTVQQQQQQRARAREDSFDSLDIAAIIQTRHSAANT